MKINKKFSNTFLKNISKNLLNIRKINTQINLIISSVILLLYGISCKTPRPESDAYGNFESVEIILSTELQGKIIDFKVEEGQNVKKDQVIIYLDTTSLHYKKQQLISQVQAAEARLFQVSDQILVMEEQKDVLQTDLERIQNLVNDGAAPEKQLDDINGQMRILKRQMRATERQKNSIAAEIKSLLFQVAQVQDQLNKCKLTSPIEGTIIEKYAEIGEIAIPGKPLVKIANLATLKLKVYISGNQLQKIKINQAVKVFVDEDEKNEKTYKGKISWIASQAEFTPKIVQTKEERVNLVYAVKIDVNNTDGYLKIGMPAEVVFLPNE